MGVTLERVQNKFACIIGELCSEPVILSKFAIWVDLRLAEYKAKGAISLDCSGESPDPLWLKGHDKPESSTISTFDEPEPYSYEHASNRPAENIPNSISIRDIEPVPVYENPPACERLSPDVVVVKEEADGESGDLYPVSFHPANLDHSLKRPAMQSGSKMYDPFLKSSPPKIGRLTTNFGSTSEDESANQSLISIIRDTKDDDTVTDSSNINFSSTMAADSDFQGQIVLSSQSMGENSLSFSPQSSSAGVTSHLSSPPLVSADGSNPLQQMIPFQSTQGDLSFSSTTSDNHSHSTMPTCMFCGKTFSRKFSLLRHQRAHHGEQRRFQCPICGLRFKEKHHMKSHRLGVHERVRRNIHQDSQSRVVGLLRDDQANIDQQTLQ